MFTHTVRPGESLWSIVTGYGLNPVNEAINKIIVANKLWRTQYLLPGQILSIPVDGLYYVIRPGDTLWAISNRFNVPIVQLVAVNSISNPALIYPGTVLKFPPVAFNPGEYLVCIDPGHQRYANYGTEPIAPGSSVMKQKVSSGTQGVVTGKPEYQLNLEVALKVEEILKLMGYRVIMTRRTNDVDLSNIQRAQIANDSGADICVRIHANSSLDMNISGVLVLYPAQDSTVNQDVYVNSRRLAELLLKNVIKETRANSGGIVPRNDITGFNWSRIPVALVEMGYMSNPAEDVKMSTPLYQYEIAEGISEGIDEYFSAGA